MPTTLSARISLALPAMARRRMASERPPAPRHGSARQAVLNHAQSFNMLETKPPRRTFLLLVGASTPTPNAALREGPERRLRTASARLRGGFLG